MKRSGISIDDVADIHNLYMAFYLAQRGRRNKLAIQCFHRDLHTQIAQLRQQLLQGIYQPQGYTSFHIRDPKPRVIHAPGFRDRVVHHALMRLAGPVIDRSLVFDTYACRLKKGTVSAVKRCQQHARCFNWFAKIDFQHYFASIDHAILKQLLRQRFKHPSVLTMFDRIIDSFAVSPGKGLPIGALTSQYFANFYLSSVDRLLLEDINVQGMARYMDDIVWFDQDKESIKRALGRVADFSANQLTLVIKPKVQINRTAKGVSFCGYRITPIGLRLLRRRKKLYAQCRKRWETAFVRGEINAEALQNGYASAFGMTVHAQAVGWRRKQLQRVPLPLTIQEWLCE